MYKTFIDHVNIEKKNAKLERHDFQTLKGALHYIRSKGAKRIRHEKVEGSKRKATGNLIEAAHDKNNKYDKDLIATYKGPEGNYFLTRRYFR